MKRPCRLGRSASTARLTAIIRSGFALYLVQRQLRRTANQFVRRQTGSFVRGRVVQCQVEADPRQTRRTEPACSCRSALRPSRRRPARRRVPGRSRSDAKRGTCVESAMAWGEYRSHRGRYSRGVGGHTRWELGTHALGVLQGTGRFTTKTVDSAPDVAEDVGNRPFGVRTHAFGVLHGVGHFPHPVERFHMDRTRNQPRRGRISLTAWAICSPTRRPIGA